MSDAGEWAKALAPDYRSLRFLTESELHGPFILEQIQRWHGCTMAEARDMRGAECLRRLTTTDFPKG